MNDPDSGILSGHGIKTEWGYERMDKKIRKDSIAVWLLKALLAAYILTGILLMLLAFLVYRFYLSEEIVTGAIIGIYVISTFVGGLIMGKLAKVRKFFWGLMMGIFYFALLLLITLGIYRTLEGTGANALTTFLLCAGGGMLGGMLS